MGSDAKDLDLGSYRIPDSHSHLLIGIDLNHRFLSSFCGEICRYHRSNITFVKGSASTDPGQVATKVSQLTGSGLIWFSEACESHYTILPRTELLFAVRISTQVWKFLWWAKKRTFQCLCLLSF